MSVELENAGVAERSLVVVELAIYSYSFICHK